VADPTLAARGDTDSTLLLRVEHAVARVLAEEPDELRAYTRLLAAIGERLDFRFGAVWRPAGPDGRLRAVACWRPAGSGLEEFERVTRLLELEPGAGLPGRTWLAREPTWIADVNDDPEFPRFAVSRAAGIVSGFGIPVSTPEGTVLGAVTFVAGERWEPDGGLVATGASIGRLVGVWMQHRRASARAEAAHTRLQASLAAAPDAVLTIDHTGRIVDVNPAAEAMFGVPAEEAVGREMAEIVVPAELRDQHREGLLRVVATGEERLIGRRIETEALDADGARIPVELTITRIDVGGAPMFTGFVRDITDRRAAFEELRASRARIVAAGDEARRRIERDLHDGAQQRLVAVALDLRLARRRLPADDGGVADLLEGAAAELEQATAELRELARGIHPAVLTERGLAPALETLVARAPETVELDPVPVERLPAPVEAAAYFTVAEALTNVTRYARASRARVTLLRADDVLRIEVSDDGVGGADAAAGSGLRGLSDRLAVVGGRLRVVSPAGEGTTVRAEVPCGW
jgi:PAS domain S-box-containing protein